MSPHNKEEVSKCRSVLHSKSKCFLEDGAVENCTVDLLGMTLKTAIFMTEETFTNCLIKLGQLGTAIKLFEKRRLPSSVRTIFWKEAIVTVIDPQNFIACAFLGNHNMVHQMDDTFLE